MAKNRYLQVLRGLAIAAVVLIHCLPQSNVTVVVRPFLNWAVAAFIFLSGLLTDEAKVMRGGCISRRLKKTVPPYLLWSVLYAVALGYLGLLGIIKALLTASAAGQMYYLLVYMQLALLTPLLYRGLKACPVLVYAITPVALIVYELLTVTGHPFPIVGRLFPVWLLYYVVGLDWGRWKRLVEGRFALCLVLWAVCLCLQFTEGSWWNAFGDYNMATTQLKMSSMACSLAAIAVAMTLPARARAWASSSVLTKLGDVSFGVYLCHIAVLAVVAKLLGLLSLPLLLATVLKWALTLGLSCAFCAVAGKVLPQKVASWIGL